MGMSSAHLDTVGEEGEVLVLDNPGLGHGVPDPDAVGAGAPGHRLHLLAVRPVRAHRLGAELHVEAEAPEHDGHAHTLLQRRERDLVSLHCSTTIPSAILFSLPLADRLAWT